MERDVLPEAAPLLRRFARARLRYDDHDARLVVGGLRQSPAVWARHFGAAATPSFIILDPDGAPITRAIGYLDVASFGVVLAYASTGAYRHATFEAYARRVLQNP